jgi:hypothetical protein
LLRLRLSPRGVEIDGSSDEGLEGAGVDLLALVDVDGARRVPSRLELKRSLGSSNDALLAKVSFTLVL